MALFSGGGDPSTNSQEGRATQNTYQSQPGITDPLAAALAQLQQGLAGQYQGLLQNPTSSPLFQGQLGPLLQSLVPSEDRARTAYTDAARSAGALRSGAYMHGLPQLEGEILGKREQTAGQLLGQSFPQLMQALQNPLGQISSLIDALKLSQGQGAWGTPGSTGGGGGGGGWGSISPSLGLATPMTPGGTTWDQLQAALYPKGGGAMGPGNYTAPASSTGGAPMANNAGSYDILSRMLGGGSGTTFNPVTGSYESASSSNLGSFTPQQGGATFPGPTPTWDPMTGAYQGGYQSQYASTNNEY